MSKEKEIVEVGMEIDVKKDHRMRAGKFISLGISALGIISSVVFSYLQDKNYQIFGDFNEDGSFRDYDEYLDN